MKTPLGIVTLVLLLSLAGIGQEKASIQVETSDKAMSFPWAGGLNACQFGRVELDGDGVKDLVVFDRQGNRLSCFLNKGGRGEINYVFAPSYVRLFPLLTDWVVFTDYDGDGREDLFTFSKGWAGMKVYRNVTDEEVGFELVAYPYLTSWQGGGEVNIIAAIGFVRREMVRQQQAMGKKKGLVMDGRDIGTVVFPQAEMKVFVTASAEVRAQRRFDELRGKGDTTTTFDEVLHNVTERDRIDSTRAESPLRQAEDAHVLDNSHMTIAEQDQWLLDLYNSIVDDN